MNTGDFGSSKAQVPAVPIQNIQVRILIADDEPIIRLDLKLMLESLGYEVVAECGDGVQAVDMARKLLPDLCVLDVKMPVLDGIDAVKVLSQENIAPAILLTAYSDRDLVDRAKNAGAFAYLVKPFKPADLPPAIEVARSRFEQHLALSKELEDVADRLEARKAIDRAKGVLMNRHAISEAEAYRMIQQESMNRRLSMRTVAEELIARMESK